MNLKYIKTKFQKSKKLAVIGILVFSANVSAEVILEHSVNAIAMTEYHSNIAYLPEAAESTYVYSFVPRYQIEALDGVNTWSGLVGITLARSSNTTVFGRREDPFATIGWTRALENGEFGLIANYSRQSTRIAQLFDTGLVAEDGTSVTRDIIANWSRSLTEKLSVAAQAGYEDNDFSNAGPLTEFTVRHANVEFSYELNQAVTPFIHLQATDYRSVGRIKFQDLLAGASIVFTPRLKVKAGAGVTRFSTTDRNEEVGFVDVDYEGQRGVATIGLSRAAFVTGINEINIGDRLNIGYVHDLSGKSRLGAQISFGQNDTNQNNQDLAGFYEHDFTETWLVRLSMGFSNIKSEGQNSINNNMLGASLTYTGLNF